jgi:signal transduction histidine kinase
MIKNFRFGVILRVCLLAATLTAWLYLTIETDYYITISLLLAIIILQIIRLINYVEQTNKKLTRFLDSIRYSDFSRSFSDQGLGGSFRELNKSFSEVINKFKEERAEKHQNYRYLQTVVQHIGIGLISFNQNGKVELINTAAKRLFDVPTLRNIRALQEISDTLFEAVTNLKGGNRTLVRVPMGTQTMQLAISATEFRMKDDIYKLVSFQNIHSELEEKEMEAWQNLTQVLAHEIMNSITPIASLSDTVYQLLKQNATSANGKYRIDEESLTDVEEALETINNRSHGLMQFVNSYRDFTQIPEPDFEVFSVKKLLKRAKNLNRGEAETQGVDVAIDVKPASLEVTADPHLIEQVLINLMKNAFRALEETEDGRIGLESEINDSGRVVIRVRDNGPGIKAENYQKIFIPFYSTSQPTKREGSGIGLSLSRQIMRKHRGTLTVTSDDESGTVFTLQF